MLGAGGGDAPLLQAGCGQVGEARECGEWLVAFSVQVAHMPVAPGKRNQLLLVGGCRGERSTEVTAPRMLQQPERPGSRLNPRPLSSRTSLTCRHVSKHLYALDPGELTKGAGVAAPRTLQQPK